MPVPDSFSMNRGSTDTGKYPLLPADSYQVVIKDIEEKKDQPVYQKPGETQDKLGFEFEIIEEGEYKGRKLWQDARPIISSGGDSNGKVFSPSTLYRLFCAVNNVKLSQDEADSVGAKDINGLIGKQVRLVVQQKPNMKGDLKNKITDFLPVKSQIKPPIEDFGDEPKDYVPPDYEPVTIDPSEIPF
jgi:hypothetical protein